MRFTEKQYKKRFKGRVGFDYLGSNTKDIWFFGDSSFNSYCDIQSSEYYGKIKFRARPKILTAFVLKLEEYSINL